MIRDIRLLKQYNFNAVRITRQDDFPKNNASAAFYRICDAYGLYVWNELTLDVDPTTTTHRHGRNSIWPQWWWQQAGRQYDLADATTMVSRSISRLVQKDYNHPSVIVWSLGNNNHHITHGLDASPLSWWNFVSQPSFMSTRERNFRQARRVIEQLDNSRPICYNGNVLTTTPIRRDMKEWTERSDLVCTAPSVLQTITRETEDTSTAAILTDSPLDHRPGTCRGTGFEIGLLLDCLFLLRFSFSVLFGRPSLTCTTIVILSEYSRAVGNSNGNLDRYWNAFWDQNQPRLQGGFVGDMVDQDVRVIVRPSKYNDHNKSHSYGDPSMMGDAIDDPRHVHVSPSADCLLPTYVCDLSYSSLRYLHLVLQGIFTPDREPHPAALELKHLQQPVIFVPHRGPEHEEEEAADSPTLIRVKV